MNLPSPGDGFDLEPNTAKRAARSAGRILEAVCFWGLIGVVVLSPLPLGSARPWAWGAEGVILGLLLLLLGIRAAVGDHPGLRGQTWNWAPAAIIGGGVIVWALFQAAAWAPPSWRHPLWQQIPSLTSRKIGGSISIDPTASLVSIFRLLEYAGIFVLAVQLCRSRERAYTAIQAVVLAGVGYSLYGLIEFGAGNRHILWLEKWAYPGDLTSTFVNHNSFATYAGIALVAGTALAIDSLRRKIDSRQSGKARAHAVIELVAGSRWWLFAGLPAIGIALPLSQSRGGLLATGASLAALALALTAAPGFAVPWRARGTIGIIAIVGLALIAYGSRTMGRIVETSVMTESRSEIYGAVARAINDFRWTGTGLGTFQFVFPAYSPPGFEEALELAHNDYLENALELGIPAAIALYLAAAWIVGLCIVGAARNRRRVIFPCIGIAISALVATHALFDFSMQIPAVAFTVALVLGVAVASVKPSAAQYD